MRSSQVYNSHIFICLSSGSVQHLGKVAFIESDTSYYAGGFMGLIRSIDPDVLPKFLFEVFNLSEFRDVIRSVGYGANINNLSNDVYKIKAPKPPIPIQEKIISECEVIDADSRAAASRIATANLAIETAINKFQSKGFPTSKLSEISLINPSKTAISNLEPSTIVSFIDMASVSNHGFIVRKEDRPLSQLKRGSYTYFADGDIIIAKITPSMENGKCAVAEALTNGIGMGSSEFHVIRPNTGMLSMYIFTFLNRPSVREEAERKMTGSSGHRRVPEAFYSKFEIPVPPDTSVQQKLIDEIDAQSQIIRDARMVIDGTQERKRIIINKYL